MAEKDILIGSSERRLLERIPDVMVRPPLAGNGNRAAWLASLLAELTYLPYAFKLPDDASSMLAQALRKAVGADQDGDEDGNSLGLRIAGTYDHPKGKAFLAASDDILALAFAEVEVRGFQEIKDDPEARLVDSGDHGCVHFGYREAYGTISERIEADLAEEHHRAKPLLICGHGVGGALATIAARHLAHQGGIGACHSFGAPCAGDRAWCEAMAAPTFRWVNAFDCIPNLPPQMAAVSKLNRHFGSSFLKSMEQHVGFEHAGELRFLTASKTGTYEDVKLVEGKLDKINYALGLKAMMSPEDHEADHSITIYRQKIAHLAARGLS